MIKHWLWGKNPVFTVEQIATAPRRRLGRVMGVELLGTPWSWVSPLWMLTAGLVLGLVVRPAATRPARLASGFGYSLAIAGGILCHHLGHLTSGRAVGAPMDADLLTATLPVNLYRNDEGRHYPSRVHLGRALGGPVGNLLVGVGVLRLRRLGLNHPVVTTFAIINLLFAVVSMAPLPTLDGGTVLRELSNWQRD